MSEEQGDIWRRVYTRMRSDKRIMALSRPTPNGLSLWYELITGEQTGITPGLFKIGERALAEQLGWPLHSGEITLYDRERYPEGLPKGFREAFAEVEKQGLVKADWNHRLVYVRNAVRANKPSNPNVVRSWRLHWRSLPECELKDEAARDIKRYLERLGEGFAKGFDEVLGTLGVNQEQEAGAGNRKQEGGKTRAKDALRQEPPPPPVGTLAEAKALLVDVKDAEAVYRFWEQVAHDQRGIGKSIVIPPAALGHAKQVLVLAGGDYALACQAISAFVKSNHRFYADRNWALYLLTDARDFERCRLASTAKEKPRVRTIFDE